MDALTNIAYILINTELGSENQVMKALEALPMVKETFLVYGMYDILTKVGFSDRSELSEIVTKKIRGITGVRSTLTVIAIQE